MDNGGLRLLGFLYKVYGGSYVDPQTWGDIGEIIYVIKEI